VGETTGRARMTDWELEMQEVEEEYWRHADEEAAAALAGGPEQ
jgi:hypothetical protein